MTGVGEMVRCRDRRGFLGVGGSSSEDGGGAFTRFFLAFTGIGSSSESEGGGAFRFFGTVAAGVGVGAGAALGLFSAPLGLPRFFATTTTSGATSASPSASPSIGTSTILVIFIYILIFFFQVLENDAEADRVSMGVHSPSFYINELEPELRIFWGARNFDAVQHV